MTGGLLEDCGGYWGVTDGLKWLMEEILEY